MYQGSFDALLWLIVQEQYMFGVYFRKTVFLIFLLSVAVSANAARGGSNFGFFDINGCFRQNFGVLKNYDPKNSPADVTAINQALDDMHANGQRRLRIPVFHSTNLALASNGSIIPHGNGEENAYGNNMSKLLRAIADKNFHAVIVGSFPVGTSEPESWSNWDLQNPRNDSRYQKNKAMVFKIYQWVSDTITKYNLPLSFKVDLRNEGAPNTWTHPNKEVYAQTLWSDFLTEFGASGRADTLGFSVAASMPNGGFLGIQSTIDHFQPVYGNQPPYLFDFHIYGPDAQSPNPSQPNDGNEYEKLVEIDRYLSLKGYGQGLVIGETYYNDLDSSSHLANAIADISRPVFYVLQWPRTRANPLGCSQVDTAPPTNYSNMLGAGL